MYAVGMTLQAGLFQKLARKEYGKSLPALHCPGLFYLAASHMLLVWPCRLVRLRSWRVSLMGSR
jgi:hypothetical protein